MRPGLYCNFLVVEEGDLATITAPVDGTEIARTSPFDITWDANNDAIVPIINLYINGPCITTWWDNVADNGLYAINADELVENTDEGDVGEGDVLDGNCDVDVILTRAVPGAMAEGLLGVIIGQSKDRVWFATTP